MAVTGFGWARVFPRRQINLRTASPDAVVIYASHVGQIPSGTVVANLPSEAGQIGNLGYRVIGELERAAAPLMLHEGAIYLHDGQSFIVERLDWDDGQAWVRRQDIDYYTQATASQQVAGAGHTRRDAGCRRSTWLRSRAGSLARSAPTAR